MAQTITIDVADDGSVTVMLENPGMEMETMEFDNTADAMQAVEGLIMDQKMDEEMDQEMGQEMEKKPNMKSMWNEEAKKRPSNPNLME